MRQLADIAGRENWGPPMRTYLIYAVWTFLAGAGIPLIGVLNSGLARGVGNPFAATAIMFAIAMAAAFALTLSFYGAPPAGGLKSVPLLSYGAGLLIGFYALSATVIIPRFGAASFVAFILIAQLLTSAVIDQFGLFGMDKRPVDISRLIGLAVIATGIAIMEIGNLRAAQS